MQFVRFVSVLTILMSALSGAEQSGMIREKAYVSDQSVAGGFPLVQSGVAADVFVSADDWKVARIAANDLTADVERVTGRKALLKESTEGLSAQAVLVGTIGKSPVIDGLIRSGKLKVDGIRNQWESFLLAVVENPLPGVKQGLVIAGSDRRGTAYGVYELSKRIGVSPWYWWADVTPDHRDELHISPERVKVGSPAVKYRGIFINDEMWGIRPWAEKTNAPDEGHGLGPKTYARVFELLLRLRANYLWPAMQDHSTPFNCYPQNKVVADDYAIVMGSSHCEPMLRNNMAGAEWDREGGGEWDYQKSPGAIRDYWARGLAANGRYENIYTLGMRGKDDEPMKFTGTEKEKIALMEQIFADQRALIAKQVNPDPTKVPQVLIPYTEVLGIYDSGLKVPDDVTICWPDDNFGYIRRLPTRRRVGAFRRFGNLLSHPMAQRRHDRLHLAQHDAPSADLGGNEQGLAIWREEDVDPQCRRHQAGRNRHGVLPRHGVQPGALEARTTSVITWCSGPPATSIRVSPMRSRTSWRNTTASASPAARNIWCRPGATIRRKPRGSATPNPTTRRCAAWSNTTPSPAAPRRCMTKCRPPARTPSSNWFSIRSSAAA